MVLIAPLDWGLGHATRCVPVIREFQRQGCEVLLAGSGDSLQLLRKEFPALRYFSLPGYQPRYPLHGSMVWTMARQLPRFMKVISDEHIVIEQIVEQENVNLVISDNRYGCWSRRVHSVFITHQSNILMPKRFGWLQDPVRRLNERLIGRFNTCWVPDFLETNSLAGNLISPGLPHLKIKTEYVGWLSRFERTADDPKEKEFDVVAIFSGPEPQRTLLENTVWGQLKRSGLSYRVVRGLPSIQSVTPDENMVNFMATEALQACIESAAVIIARSGYSTIMDMCALGKKVILIPTPNQTEQKYLANRLKEEGIAFYMEQNEFDLETALRQAKHYRGFEPPPMKGLLQEAITSVLTSGS